MCTFVHYFNKSLNICDILTGFILVFFLVLYEFLFCGETLVEKMNRQTDRLKHTHKERIHTETQTHAQSD